MFGVYVHVPWCRTRCPYCAFAVDTRGQPAEAAWLAGIRRDWARERPHFQGRPETLSFGGGTPSRADPASLAEIIDLVQPLGEVSLEVNPDDVDSDRIAMWRAAGLTRVSVGVQTWSLRLAPRLGRAHSARQADQALDLLVRAGFRSVSVDLMFGLAEGTEAELLADIDHAAAAGVDHLSLYSLTIEDGTRFSSDARPSIDDDVWAAHHDAAVARLAHHGLERYELSNFARRGHRSAHNEHYWRARRWAGLGPSAHGWRPDGVRVANANGFDEWIADAAPTLETPSREALLYELVWSTLRHVDGVDVPHVERLTGQRLLVPEAIVAAGLVVHEGGRIRLTPAGFSVSDAVVRRIVDHSLASPLPTPRPVRAYSRALEPSDDN